MRRGIWHQLLLVCGIVASLTYVIADIYAGTHYSGYSFIDQAVSELFAIGVSTSHIVVPLFTLSSALVAVFAFGVWTGSHHNRAMRWLAIMLFGNAVDSLVLMHWLSIDEAQFLRRLYLGLKHFRTPPETARVMPTVFSDSDLRGLRVPTLVLYGDHEVICDPTAALTRARRLMPDFEGQLIPGCSHDRCSTQSGRRTGSRFFEETNGGGETCCVEMRFSATT